MDLLESAISRQFTGYEERLKYDTSVSSASSLAYGICSNHPFHNGNKRTALVCLLCHLDKNDLTFQENVSQDELYALMLKIASHGFAPKRTKEDLSDVEVDEVSRWIRKRIRRIDHRERIITFRELKGILKAHGFELENPKGNHIDVVRYVAGNTIFGIQQRPTRQRVLHLPNPGDGIVVSKGVLKRVRDSCGLTEDKGCDSHMFYAKTRPADYFVAEYRWTLKRLART